MSNNSTNLKRIDGGHSIKQGDFSSKFTFELQDEDYKPIEIGEEKAVVTLESYSGDIYFRKEVDVIDNQVSFTIDKVIPVTSYNVEVRVAGYVFPSDKSVEISVEKGHDDYEVVDPLDKVVTTQDVEEIVEQKLENIGGATGPQGVPGEVGKSAYQIWLSLGNTGTEQDFINSLKPNITAIKRGPTGYYLDRTSTPWTIVFDNGCSMQMPDYKATETVYGYGFGNVSPFGQDVLQYPLGLSVVRTSNGSLSIPKWQANNAGALYWADNTLVINPINDKQKFNFNNAKYNPADTNSTSLLRQKNVIRVMYELGIWSESDILMLGAVKV